MRAFEHEYLDIMHRLLKHGHEKPDRTGTGTRSLFDVRVSMDFETDGFPLIHSKKVHFDTMWAELRWFLEGGTNVEDLEDADIWDQWADEDGELGPIYGKQWRGWEAPVEVPDIEGHVEMRATAPGANEAPTVKIDQIQKVIHGLQENPHSRRHIVSAWNVGALHKMALPPCHVLFQFYARPIHLWQRAKMAEHFHVTEAIDGVQTEGGGYERVPELPDDARTILAGQLDDTGVPRHYLDCKMYQRSGDWFIGVPFNIASYGLLTMIIAEMVGMAPGRVTYTFGDAHLYENHIEQAKKQLGRRTNEYDRPTVTLSDDVAEIRPEDLEEDDVELHDYEPSPWIPAPVNE